MRILRLEIHNFKSIRELTLTDVENALILVGQNNTGKTAVMDAIRAVGGEYAVGEEDFQEDFPNIEILVDLALEQEDLERLHRDGAVSRYRRFESWYQDFCKKLPSYRDGTLSFSFVANREGKVRYEDGRQKNNLYVKQIFPKVYYLDARRNLRAFQDDLLLLQEGELLRQMRSGCCMFDRSKKCNRCFSCMGLILKKSADELNALEAARLLEYKLYQQNLDGFSRRINRNFRKNGGMEELIYSMNRNVEQMLSVTVETWNRRQNKRRSIDCMGQGMRSIYMLSLLETYEEEECQNPGIILVEDPEIFLHPRLQRVAGEILYRLSRKNQVVFSTHSPNLLANFNSRQIRQILLGEDGYSRAAARTDISAVLDDLGYSASDLMNVNFVFIVEGKDDKSRLPLLIRKYYEETYDEAGNLSRIAIITTNSCTNIKTYANLKYMNQVYLRDQFLMIRDGDGKDPEELAGQLCGYYEERSREDVGQLPRVTRKNVLILKYYSFENYFLNPQVMTALGIVESPEAFYKTLYEKWREYLYRIRSGRHLREMLGRDFTGPEDMKAHMEEIRIYLRGHNLYDIFYGPFKEREREILREYIRLAPREDFEDILGAIDQFIYFDSRRMGREG